MAKSLHQLEAKLGGVLLDSLSAEASTASIRVNFYDKDDPSTQRTPDADTKKFAVDPENSQGKGKVTEFLLCESHSTTNGITTLVNVTRGLQRDATVNLTGSATRAQAWDSGTPIGVATEPHNINLMKAYFEGSEPVPDNMEFDGDLQFDGTNTHNGPIDMNGSSSYFKAPNLTEVERDALTPSNGMLIYNTTGGTFDVYDGGVWTALDTGAAISNASETVTGIVQLATDAQAVAGTDTDGGDPLVVKPSQLLDLIQNSSTNYAVDSVGTDSYAITLTPAPSAYSDGQVISFEAGTANTAAATIDVNSLGAMPLKKANYFDLITGDITEDQKIFGQVSVKDVTFNAVFVGGETSGTLTGNWDYKTGVYSVEFSNGDRRDVTLTNGATSATWSGVLSGAATADAEAQWFEMHTPPSALTGESDSSLQHYHDLVRNNSLSRRITLSGTNTNLTGASTGNSSGVNSVTTSASNNNMARIDLIAHDPNGNLSSQVSVHDRNSAFRFYAVFAASTAQEGFIGWCPFTFGGTNLENSVMTTAHIGFIVEDDTLYISIANGTNQEKTDISGTISDVTVGHVYEAYHSAGLASFYVDNVLVGTLNQYLPINSINTFRAAVIADASATARTIRLLNSGWMSFDE